MMMQNKINNKWGDHLNNLFSLVLNDQREQNNKMQWDKNKKELMFIIINVIRASVNCVCRGI